MYLTVAEYRSAPTSVATDQLVVDGTDAEQVAELVRVIRRASAWIDQTIHPNRLVADVHHRTERGIVDRRGDLLLRPGMFPLRALHTLAVGADAGHLATVSDLTGVWVDRGLYRVPGAAGPLVAQPVVRYTFTAGFPNTVLTATATAAATQLQVASTAGMTATAPATELTIEDGELTETVTVTDVVSATTVSVTALAHTHTFTAGDEHAIAVHSMPPDVKHAAILLTSIVARSRGNDAYTMREPGPAGQVDPVSANDWLTVRDILANWAPLA